MTLPEAMISDPAAVDVVDAADDGVTTAAALGTAGTAATLGTILGSTTAGTAATAATAATVGGEICIFSTADWMPPTPITGTIPTGSGARSPVLRSLVFDQAAGAAPLPPTAAAADPAPDEELPELIFELRG